MLGKKSLTNGNSQVGDVTCHHAVYRKKPDEGPDNTEELSATHSFTIFHCSLSKSDYSTWNGTGIPVSSAKVCMLSSTKRRRPAWTWSKGLQNLGPRSKASKVSTIHTRPCADTPDSAHIPNSGAQLWRFHKASQGEVYAIENLRGRLVLTAMVTWPPVHVALRTLELTLAAGTKEQIVGQAKPNLERKVGTITVPYPREALWAVDSSLYSMEPGKMVL